MNNEFVNRLKNIENELLNLKTASKYSSVRSANTTSTGYLTTGLYTIVYEPKGEPIISFFYQAVSGPYCWVYARTPDSNSQILEINTTYWDNQQQQYITDSCPINIVSNVPILSIERIS